MKHQASGEEHGAAFKSTALSKGPVQAERLNALLVGSDLLPLAVAAFLRNSSIFGSVAAFEAQI